MDKRSGFTLVEVVVVLLLVSMLLLVATQLLFFVYEQYQGLRNRVELTQNMQYLANCISEDVAKSSAFVATTSTNEALLTSSTLVLLQQQRSLHSGQTNYPIQTVHYGLKGDNQAHTYSHRLAGKAAYRQVGVSGDKDPIANFIQSMTFTYLDELQNPVRLGDQPQGIRLLIVTDDRGQRYTLERLIFLPRIHD